MRKELGKKLMALSIVCVSVLTIAAGCKETEKTKGASETAENVFQSTEHSEIYDITRHDCSQYQWFVMDTSGSVLDCGVTMDNPPEIVETDDSVSVFIASDEGKGEYREYTPSTGGVSQWFERRQEGDGEFVYFVTKVGEFVFPEVLEAYWDVEDGVNRDSFVNYEEADYPVEDYDSAYERAKNEVGTDYNAVAVDYDKDYEMWAVFFYDKDSAGGSKTVYLDASGKTWLIISGE